MKWVRLIRRMNAIPQIIESLARSPFILEDLIGKIPEEKMLLNRIPGKWSIHEHACHLVDVQPMIIERMERFKQEEAISFRPYLPGKTVDVSYLRKMDLKRALREFYPLREQLLDIVSGFDESTWRKTAEHPEYEIFTAEIQFRHVLLHDHTHMYRIEELWITRDDFL